MSDEQIKLQKQQLKQQQRQEAMMEKQAQEMANIQMPAIPAAPAPVTTPPPPTQMSADIQVAEDQARRAAANRYGFMRTTYAGNTGGYMGSPLGNSGNGKPTLG
jgi:hypothetical protein